MAKSKEVFLCSECGNEFAKWTGQCSVCKAWNTLSQFSAATTKNRNTGISNITPISPKDLTLTSKAKITTNIEELDRVLGGGTTESGVYLISGQPGIGKSTLLTNLALNQKAKVLYVCAEENPTQVSLRINRLSAGSEIDHILLLGTNSLEDIKKVISIHSDIALLIVDSIQTVMSDDIPGLSGTPSQIRHCCFELIKATKGAKMATILVGHVTKSGDLAGPKLLEHMVDVVLELEGDRHYDLRLLRGVKNRFGPNDETGIFRLTSNGIEGLKDPNLLFGSDLTKNLPGSVHTMIMEGTRPISLEVQCLVVPTELAIPRRVAQGIPVSRLQLICAVLTKHKNSKLNNYDVFVNVTGGLNIKEPSADLAIALSIESSLKNKPLPTHSIAIGEMGLLGEIRPVPFLDKRIRQAEQLGFTTFITSKEYQHLKDIKI